MSPTLFFPVSLRFTSVMVTAISWIACAVELGAAVGRERVECLS